MLKIDYQKLKEELRHCAANPYKGHLDPGSKEWMKWLKQKPNRGRADTYMTLLCCLKASLRGRKHLTRVREDTAYKLGLVVADNNTLPLEEKIITPIYTEDNEDISYPTYYEVSQKGNDILGMRLLQHFLLDE
jgi:hypothetical protein